MKNLKATQMFDKMCTISGIVSYMYSLHFSLIQSNWISLVGQ